MLPKNIACHAQNQQQPWRLLARLRKYSRIFLGRNSWLNHDYVATWSYHKLKIFEMKLKMLKESEETTKSS